MKLVVTKNRANSIYKSKFELTEINEFDQAMLDGLEGTLELNVGGDVVKKEMVDDGAGGTTEKITVLLKQGDKFVKFPSAMPIEKAWLVSRFGDEKAKEIAQLETDQIAKRIVALVDEMKANPDDFSGKDEIILTP